MKKKLLLLLVCSMTAVWAFAQTSGTCGANLTWNFDSGTGTLTISGTGAMTNYDATKLNSPPWEGFWGQIIKVEIEDGVENIGNYAFPSCTNLISIIIPNSVNTIGDSALSSCNSLTSITIPSSVTSIGDYVFAYCQSLTKIINKATTPQTINATVFNGFNGFNKTKCTLYVPIASMSAYRSATEWKDFMSIIGNNSDCATPIASGMTGALTWTLCPNGTLTISGTGAMANYTTSSFAPWYNIRTQITQVEIGDEVTNIGNYTFYGCTGLTSVTIPNNVTNIGNYAFQNCSGLTSVTIGNGVVSIGNAAFGNCSNLSTLNYNAINCTKVGSGSERIFTYCNALKTINIGVQVTAIPTYVFYGPPRHEDVTVGWNTPPVNSLFTFGGVLCTLHVPAGTKAAYQAVAPWSNFGNILEPGETATNLFAITDGVLTGYYGKGGDITIPTDVTSIGDNAFAYCSGITSITLPEGVTNIDNYAFQYCSGLKNIYFPKSLVRIGFCPFDHCSSLTDMYFASTVAPDLNGNYIACETSGNLAVHVPQNSVGYTSDRGWPSDVSVPLEADGLIYSILSKADKTMQVKAVSVTFGNDDNLIVTGNTAISSIPSIRQNFVFDNETYTVTTIGSQGFSHCSNLTSLTLPSFITTIGNNAFEGCTGLTNLVIPNSVATIETYAFSGCTGLTSVTIPGSVTSLGFYLFSGCTNVSSLTFASSLILQGDGTGTSFLGRLFLFNYGGGTVDGYVYQGNAYYVPTSLKSVTLLADANNVVIPTGYFQNTNLENITISNNVTSIGSSAFSGCSALPSVTIPNSVTSIGKSAFYGCSSIKNIRFEDGNSTLAFNYSTSSSPYTNDVFNNCPLDTLYLGRNISYNNTYDTNTAHDISPFYNKTTSKHITIGNSVTSVNVISDFSGCNGMEYLRIGNGIISFSNGILSSFQNLKELTLPFVGTSANATGADGILGALFGTSSASTAITQYYGSGSSENGKYAIPQTLEKLTVTRPATQIGYGALYNCNMLKEVTIPSTVRGLGEKALYGCSGLENIYSEWANPPAAYNSSTFAGVNKFACIVHVPIGSKTKYSLADGWKEFYIDNIQEEAAVTIIAQPVPLYGGIISGTLQYNYDATATLTASGNMGYDFKGWMEDNKIVSASNAYSFVVNGPRTLYAIFTPRENGDENIQIQTQTHSASISWIAVTDATNYTLIIYSDESRTQEIARFQLDVNGNVLKSTQQTLSCTVPNLDASVQYYYSLTSYDNKQYPLTVSNGGFITLSLNGIIIPQTDNQIRIFPNPVSDSFHIGGIEENTLVTVLDMVGKTVLQQTVNRDESVAVGRLPKGVYLIVVKGKTLKMIKD